MTILDINSCLIHFILNVPFSITNFSTIFGSVVQVSNRNISGLIIARRLPFAKNWIIGPVVVDKKYRGEGIGNKMMQFTFQTLISKKANGVLVTVDDTDNHLASRNFFRKFGFKVQVQVFTNRKQAYKYARLLSKGQPLSKVKKQKLQQNSDSKNSNKLFNIFFKNLTNQESNRII